MRKVCNRDTINEVPARRRKVHSDEADFADRLASNRRSACRTQHLLRLFPADFLLAKNGTRRVTVHRAHLAQLCTVREEDAKKEHAVVSRNCLATSP